MSTHPYERVPDIIRHLDEMHNGRGYYERSQTKEHAHEVHKALHVVEK